MRYALRNKNKISSKLGEAILNRLIKSLDIYFKEHGEDIQNSIKTSNSEPYPILIIDDAEHTCNVIAFYIVRKMYDVHTLAFKEFIG